MQEKMIRLVDLEAAMDNIVVNGIRQWNKSYHSYTKLWKNDEKASVSNLTDEAGYMEYARVQLQVILDIYEDLLGHEYTGKIPTSFIAASEDPE